MKGSVINDSGEDKCPWCDRAYNEAIYRKMTIVPCGDFGCFSCLRSLLVPVKREDAQKQKICKTCDGVIEKMEVAEEEEEEDVKKVAKASEDDEEQEAKRDKEEEEDVVLFSDEDDDDDGDNDEEVLRKLRSVRLPDDNIDWTCAVCSFLFDNKNYMPMRVSKCKPSPSNMITGATRSDDEEGCGHTVCEPCSIKTNDEFTKGDQHSRKCIFCRRVIAAFEVNLPLLKKIVAFLDGQYVALVQQINEANAALNPVADAQNELKSQIAELKESKEKWKMEAQGAAGVKMELNRVKNERDMYANRVRDNDTLRKDKDDLMKTNGILYDELISARLMCVASGALAKHQLGLSIRGDGPGGSIQGANPYIIVQVSTGTNTSPGPSLVYGRKKRSIDRYKDAQLRRIDQYNMDVQRILSDDKTAIVVPSEEELSRSYVKSFDDNHMMVKTGTWLFRAIMDQNAVPESVFDGGLNTDIVDPDSLYRPISSEQFVRAIEYYNDFTAKQKQRDRLLKEHREKEKTRQVSEQQQQQQEPVIFDNDVRCIQCLLRYHPDTQPTHCNGCGFKRCDQCHATSFHYCTGMHPNIHCRKGTYGEALLRVNLLYGMPELIIWAYRAFALKKYRDKCGALCSPIDVLEFFSTLDPAVTAVWSGKVSEGIVQQIDQEIVDALVGNNTPIVKFWLGPSHGAATMAQQITGFVENWVSPQEPSLEKFREFCYSHVDALLKPVVTVSPSTTVVQNNNNNSVGDLCFDYENGTISRGIHNAHFFGGQPPVRRPSSSIIANGDQIMGNSNWRGGSRVEDRRNERAVQEQIRYLEQGLPWDSPSSSNANDNNNGNPIDEISVTRHPQYNGPPIMSASTTTTPWATWEDAEAMFSPQRDNARLRRPPRSLGPRHSVGPYQNDGPQMTAGMELPEEDDEL